MATKKVGDLIKEARTNAGLSQEKLAAAIDGLSASELGKAERGEKDLTTEELKAIAKMTGVTQKSLLEAPKNLKTTAAKTTAAKTSTAKTSTAKTTTTGKTTAAKTAGKTSTAKTSGKTSTTGKTTAKTSSSSSTGTSMKVTATEKKLVELYREADSETKKKVMNILKGKEEEGGDLLNTLLGGALGEILKK